MSYVNFSSRYKNWQIQSMGLLWAAMGIYNTVQYGWKTSLIATPIIMTAFDYTGYILSGKRKAEVQSQ